MTAPTSTVFQLLKSGRDVQTFATGQVIFERGQPGEQLYYVIEGIVDIHFQGRVINTHGASEVFGEMSLIDGSPRSADAKARTDCRVVAIGESRLLFLVQQHPQFALEMLRTLAERLRRRTED